MSRPHKIMLIVGEISGDMHAAPLVRELKKKYPDCIFFGTGGDNMAREGVRLHYHVKDLAVIGFVEVLKRLAFFRKLFNEMLALVKAEKPDTVILVDYPGFNIRFAKQAHNLGLKVIYYICPQVWAWNRRRIPGMAKSIDRLITIFPFEPDYFKGTELKADFAGHPLVQETAAALAAPRSSLPWTGTSRIALLPGSRRMEIERILPVMIKAASLISKKKPDATFLVASPTNESADLATKIASSLRETPKKFGVITGNTREVLIQARAAMVASGTATVETALLGCPLVVAYKVAWPTYFMAWALISIKHIGMVNIVAGKTICPEFIQGNATPKNIAEALLPLIEDSEKRKTMLMELTKVRNILNGGDPAVKAAEIIVESYSQ